MAWYTNPATLYLVLYNVACIVGWGYIYTIFYGHYEATGHFYGASLWKVLELPLKVVQTAAVMEVVHASVGLVKSNAFLTGVQVLSRLAVLWFIMHVSTAAQASPALFLCTLSWSLVEVPRYSYYLYKLCDIEPFYAHKWVRYSLFLVLYPTGIAGEIGNLLYALPGAAAINVSPGPGNALNVAYNHQVFLAILLLLYIPGSPLMIGHMWKERCKQLAAPTTTGASKDDRKSK